MCERRGSDAVFDGRIRPHWRTDCGIFLKTERFRIIASCLQVGASAFNRWSFDARRFETDSGCVGLPTPSLSTGARSAESIPRRTSENKGNAEEQSIKTAGKHFCLSAVCCIQKIFFQKILRPTAIKPYLWGERNVCPLRLRRRLHELQILIQEVE